MHGTVLHTAYVWYVVWVHDMYIWDTCPYEKFDEMCVSLHTPLWNWFCRSRFAMRWINYICYDDYISSLRPHSYNYRKQTLLIITLFLGFTILSAEFCALCFASRTKKDADTWIRGFKNAISLSWSRREGQFVWRSRQRRRQQYARITYEPVSYSKQRKPMCRNCTRCCTEPNLCKPGENHPSLCINVWSMLHKGSSRCEGGWRLVFRRCLYSSQDSKWQ